MLFNRSCKRFSEKNKGIWRDGIRVEVSVKTVVDVWPINSCMTFSSDAPSLLVYGAKSLDIDGPTQILWYSSQSTYLGFISTVGRAILSGVELSTLGHRTLNSNVISGW